jgi:hypothetical protein
MTHENPPSSRQNSPFTIHTSPCKDPMSSPQGQTPEIIGQRSFVSKATSLELQPFILWKFGQAGHVDQEVVELKHVHPHSKVSSPGMSSLISPILWANAKSPRPVTASHPTLLHARFRGFGTLVFLKMLPPKEAWCTSYRVRRDSVVDDAQRSLSGPTTVESSQKRLRRIATS